VDGELLVGVKAVAFTSRALERGLDELTLPQFRVLTLLAGSPERASRIAELAAVSRPSLTGILDGLEAKGFIRRQDVAGDRRGVQLGVTAAGRKALAKAERDATAALAELLGRLDEKGRAAALDGLAALHAALASRHAAAAAPA
jgi:DNA-binding MarR family transcriptional regulator